MFALMALIGFGMAFTAPFIKDAAWSDRLVMLGCGLLMAVFGAAMTVYLAVTGA